MNYVNTETGFYFHWTRDQLVAELIRINGLMADVAKELEKVSQNISEIGLSVEPKPGNGINR